MHYQIINSDKGLYEVTGKKDDVTQQVNQIVDSQLTRANAIIDELVAAYIDNEQHDLTTGISEKYVKQRRMDAAIKTARKYRSGE